MNKDLKDFILKHKEDIDNNEWDKVYANMSTVFRGDLTSVLSGVSIDPLPYMSKVPEYFAEGSQINITQIPDNIKNIEEKAFSSCKNLTSITISVTNIGYGAFSNCSNLTGVTISNGVKRIGGYVFYKCSSLTGVGIPNSLISIGQSAFSDCPYLKILRYSGTRAEWKSIRKSPQWNFESAIEKIECIDGTIPIK